MRYIDYVISYFRQLSLTLYIYFSFSDYFKAVDRINPEIDPAIDFNANTRMLLLDEVSILSIPTIDTRLIEAFYMVDNVDISDASVVDLEINSTLNSTSTLGVECDSAEMVWTRTSYLKTTSMVSLDCSSRNLFGVNERLVVGVDVILTYCISNNYSISDSFTSESKKFEMELLQSYPVSIYDDNINIFNNYISVINEPAIELSIDNRIPIGDIVILSASKEKSIFVSDINITNDSLAINLMVPTILLDYVGQTLQSMSAISLADISNKII